MKNVLKKSMYVTMAAASAVTTLGVSSLADENAAVEYSVPVKLKNAMDKNQDSMGNKAVNGSAKVIEKDGKAEIILNLKGLKANGLNGHLMKLEVFDTDANSNLTQAEVVKTAMEDDLFGKKRSFPSQIKINRNATKEEYILAQVAVDAMDSLSLNEGEDPYADANIGKGAQKLYIELDYKNAKKISTQAPAIKSSRISGSDRYETSVAISKKNFASADTVVIANGTGYADALAAAPLANQNHAPILLSKAKDLPQSTLNEIKRLKASKVIIVGGENSISSNIVSKLEKDKLTVERISGDSRYATAVKIAEKIRETSKDSNEAILVSGSNFADALSVSSLANKTNAPIILTSSKKMPKGQENTINSWNLAKLTVVGGQNSVSQEAVAGIKASQKARIEGRDRYETSALVVKQLNSTSGKLMLASGKQPADALSAGAVTELAQRPLLLVSKNKLSNSAKELINKGIKDVEIIGGTGTIAADILK